MKKTTSPSKNIFGSKPLRNAQYNQPFAGRMASPQMSLSGSDPLVTGVNLAQQDLNNSINIRNKHDDNADFYNELSQLGGERPEGAAAALSGFFSGLGHSEKTRSTAKKQEAVDKYNNRVEEYFRQVVDETNKMKQWYQKREFAQQKYLPQILAYAENIDKLDAQSQRIMAQNILEGWNRATGDDYKIVAIDASDPFIMTINSKDGMQVADLRDMFSGHEVLQQRLAMKTPEYQLKMQQDREDRERALKIQEGKLELDRQYASEKYALQRDRVTEIQRRNDQNETKSDMKLSETVGKKIDSANEFLHIVPKMEKIVKDHPDIFQSAMDAVWRESENPGITSNIIKDVQQRFNPEKATALTSMIKYINKMTLDVANGFSRPNMFIEKIGSKAVPNLDMTPDAFLKVLNEMADEKKREVQNNLQRFERFTNDKKLLDQYTQSSSNAMQGQNNDQWSKIYTPIWTPSQ